jgi:recombinational DNA repair ATPase RecF/ElaB/YqjD/DUF883 family membrane-anchored ribosome-binding protein
MYPDAVGYLNDLATEINEPWFRMICDLTATGGISNLDQLTQDTIVAVYTERASYIGVMPAAVSAAIASAPNDFLDQLSGFTNFKRLGDALEVSFNKQVNLIFGTNGSGKSSLCESLKVLATTELPNRPLQNVRTLGAGTPTFQYKFKTDAAHQTWTPAVGYGPKCNIVKYFDTAIAIMNVKNAVDPGRVIALTPFRLHIFEWTKSLTTKLREALLLRQHDNSAKLTKTLAEIRVDFSKFKGRPLSVIDDKTVAVLPSQIALGEGFVDQILLSEKQSATAQLEKAASEEGLKLLRAEHRDLETFLISINALLTAAASMWALEPTIKAKNLAQKKSEQELLAKVLIPKDGTLDGLLDLLRATSPLCKLDDAADHLCPLCMRDLGAPEVELFKLYYDLLVGELEKDITALKKDIDKAAEFGVLVDNESQKGWEKYTTIQTEVLTAAKTASDSIVASCNISTEPTSEAKKGLESLKLLAGTLATQAESKKNAIDTAMKGREELLKQLTKLRGEIEPLEYSQTIAAQLNKFHEAQWRVERSKFWSVKLPSFTQILTKITNKAKDAHEELVVIDFEGRLNEEYKALTEKSMASFGVTLARRGADAAVTVLPQIGGKDIEGVLSEGEQRVHALALFFAEIETCPQSVLVFDDPVSSFDYNYITNYCIRLRDFSQKHPAHQIIVLTHNWEFFVQLQTTLKQSGLEPHLSVQVLENCSVIAEYSEKLDELKKSIESFLKASGEPSKSQKEELAGKMRRLIEVVINTHVFNQQRHQYKQKNQAISTFLEFTKIVALQKDEAQTLRDLYSKLSVSEHDDPRNAYVNSDKAMFQTRYDEILNIETAIASRKP